MKVMNNKKLTARRYLEQIQEFDIYINQDLERLEEMKINACSTGAIDYSSLEGATVSVQGTVNFGGKATDTAMVTISTDFNETIRADMDAKAASGVVQVDFIEIKTT